MRVADLPDFRDRGCPDSLARADRKECNLQQLVKNYYRVLLGVDENVGRVLDYLGDEGELENTIVVYTSDNGFFLGDHGLMDKRLMYEESISVPYVISWPAGLPKGAVDDKHMVLNVDFAPTLLELLEFLFPLPCKAAASVRFCTGRIQRLACIVPVRILRVPGSALCPQESGHSDSSMETDSLLGRPAILRTLQLEGRSG